MRHRIRNSRFRGLAGFVPKAARRVVVCFQDRHKQQGCDPSFRFPTANAERTDPFRKTFLFELKADFIGAAVGEIGDARRQPEDEHDRRINAERDAGIAMFDLAKGRPRDESAFRHRRRGDAPPQPRAADVLAELGEGALDG